jgi:hypothetical protein
MQIGAWLAFVTLAAVVSGAAAQQAAPAADSGVVAPLRKHDEAPGEARKEMPWASTSHFSNVTGPVPPPPAK